jgi:hypothetical protein
MNMSFRSRVPNQRAGVDAGFSILFVFERAWSGTTQCER